MTYSRKFASQYVLFFKSLLAKSSIVFGIICIGGSGFILILFSSRFISKEVSSIFLVLI